MNKPKQTNLWRLSTLILLTSTIFLAGLSFQFYGRSLESETRYSTLLTKMNGIFYKIDFLINFGNGTKIWYNETLVPIGLDLLNLTLRITERDVEFTGGEYGSFVNSIKGVGANSSAKSLGWLWWHYGTYREGWTLGQVGANQYILSDRDIVAWYYQDTSKYPNLEPPS